MTRSERSVLRLARADEYGEVRIYASYKGGEFKGKRYLAAALDLVDKGRLKITGQARWQEGPVCHRRWTFELCE